MQIYAKLNDNKSIQSYSNEQQEGYKALTIDAADAHFLPEYHGLMWADDNGLVHAENIPATSYERKLAAQEEAIKTASKEADKKLAEFEDKIIVANDAYNKLDSANSQLDNKLENINKAVLDITQAMAAIAPVNDETTKGE